VLSVYGAGETLEPLDDVYIYGESRTAMWVEQPAHTDMFDFPTDLVMDVQSKELAFHAHSMSVELETYQRLSGLY